MWIPEVSLGNATFQEPVQDVEKVPKTRWKLVSICIFLVRVTAANAHCSHAIYANKRWVHAYSVATSRVSKPSMSLALEERDFAYE